MCGDAKTRLNTIRQCLLPANHPILPCLAVPLFQDCQDNGIVEVVDSRKVSRAGRCLKASFMMISGTWLGTRSKLRFRYINISTCTASSLERHGESILFGQPS